MNTRPSHIYTCMTERSDIPLLASEGMLAACAAGLLFVMQLLAMDAVVEETPVVTD